MEETQQRKTTQGGKHGSHDGGHGDGSLVEGANQRPVEAYIAAWLGWTLDAFDFTIFLLIMVPISQEFGVPLTAVTAVFTVTLWLRLVGRPRPAGWPTGWVARRR